MRINGKGLAVVILTVAAASAVMLVLRSAGVFYPVAETVPRLSLVAGTKAPVENPLNVSYLDPLPEPKMAVVAAPDAAAAPRAPASIAATAVSTPEEETAPEPVKAKSAAPAAECALGSHPIDDCDCLSADDTQVSLRLHPSESCLNEEAARTGHQVLLSDGDDRFELAGDVPEQAKPVVTPATSPAAVIAPTVVVSRWQPRHERRHGSRSPRVAPLIASSAAPAEGVCPAGTKDEICRCALPGENSFVRKSNPPSVCANPLIQRSLGADYNVFMAAYASAMSPVPAVQIGGPLTTINVPLQTMSVGQ